MKCAQSGQPRSLTSTFTRKVTRTNLFLVLFAVVAFGVGADRLLYAHTTRLLSEQARLCAASLVPGPSGDLSVSIDRLRARYDGLVAVATLDAYGRVHTIQPERPAHRDAVQAAINTGTDSIGYKSITTLRNGKPVTVAGVVVPINGSSSPTARKAVMLLRHDSYLGDWARATALFAVFAGLATVLGTRSMEIWFERQVTQPLQSVVSVCWDPSEGKEQAPVLEPGDCRETAQIARQFRRLLRIMGVNAARARRTQRETLRQVREREAAFGRELKRARDQTMIDPLTKLRNRTFLEEELEPLYQYCRAKNEDLSAAMMDVDNFKQYNDTHGHQAGDALMQFLGALLRGGLRPTDRAIRYGGDEFLILLPGTGAGDAAAIAQRLMKLFGQYIGRLGGNHRLSLSAGVASFKTDEVDTGHALVARADAALYAAKRRGKNAVVGLPAVAAPA